MAGVDYYNRFTYTTDPQALGSTVATQSTDTIDLGAGKDAFGATLANPDIGMGKPVFVNIEVASSAASSTSSATATFELWHSADNTTFTKLAGTVAVSQSTLVAGYKTFIAVPPNAKRYLQVQTITGTETFTAGKYSAWLSGEPVATY